MNVCPLHFERSPVLTHHVTSSNPPTQPFLVGGAWQETDNHLPVINPFDGRIVANVCQADSSHIETAIQSALRGFQAFRHLSSYARSHALAQVAQALTSRLEEFANVICLEAGKPILDARREVGRAIQTFTIASEEAKRIPGEMVPMDITPGMERHIGLFRRFPIGPVLGITPFNFPLNLVAHKVAPCLAVGNPMVLKPAPQTPLTALLLGKILMEVGLPEGTISILPCDNQLAENMVSDPRFEALSFTGSASVGWRLKARAGKKRVLLELGGNAGVIVEPDANIEVAAQRCATGGFSYSGQTCISVQRIFVHDSIFESFKHALLGRVQKLVVGDPQKETTTVGPLINEATAQRVESWVQEASVSGAQILIGGTRRDALVIPTVLDHVHPDMKVSCEEIFGPVVTLTRYHDFSEALRLLNDTPFGLQAGIFTNDVNKIFYAYQELQVGTVLANEIPTFRADHMPYGGIKDSGLGREGVRFAMSELTEPKMLVINLIS